MPNIDPLMPMRGGFIADKATPVSVEYHRLVEAYKTAQRERDNSKQVALMNDLHHAVQAYVYERGHKYPLNLVGKTFETVEGPMTVASVDSTPGGFEVCLTWDGLPAIRDQWHEGRIDPEFDPWVYYEAWTYSRETGKITDRYHGWVHPESRCLTQVG